MVIAIAWLLGAVELAPPSPAAVAKHATGLSLTLTIRDYPREARAKGETGRVVFRYLIDVAGRARDCEIVQSSGSAALDAKSCEIVTRGRFRPARDVQGNPVPEYWRWAIEWRDPKGPIIVADELTPENQATPTSDTAKSAPAAPAISVGQANWEAMPRLEMREGSFDPTRVNEEVRHIIASRQCEFPAARPDKYSLVVNYALLLSPDGTVEQALVEDVGCRPLETIVASMITSTLRLNSIDAPGVTGKKWHRGSIHFKESKIVT